MSEATLGTLYDLWVGGEHRAVIERFAAVVAESPRKATYLAVRLSKALPSVERERLSDMLASRVYGRTALPESRMPNPTGRTGCEGCRHCLPVANLDPEACARCDRWCNGCSKAHHPGLMVPFALPGQGRVSICHRCSQIVEEGLREETMSETPERPCDCGHSRDQHDEQGRCDECDCSGFAT